MIDLCKGHLFYGLVMPLLSYCFRRKPQNLTPPGGSDSSSCSGQSPPNRRGHSPTQTSTSPSQAGKRPGYFENSDDTLSKKQRISRFQRPSPQSRTEPTDPRYQHLPLTRKIHDGGGESNGVNGVKASKDPFRVNSSPKNGFSSSRHHNSEHHHRSEESYIPRSPSHSPPSPQRSRNNNHSANRQNHRINNNNNNLSNGLETPESSPDSLHGSHPEEFPDYSM